MSSSRPARLRPYLIDAVQRGMQRTLAGLGEHEKEKLDR